MQLPAVKLVTVLVRLGEAEFGSDQQISVVACPAVRR